jgi:hypothetical protein
MEAQAPPASPAAKWEEQVMKLDCHGIAAALGVALGTAVIAAAVLTDEYARAAWAEARGYDSLFHALAATDRDGCGAAPGSAPAATVSVTLAAFHEGQR